MLTIDVKGLPITLAHMFLLKRFLLDDGFVSCIKFGVLGFGVLWINVFFFFFFYLKMIRLHPRRGFILTVYGRGANNCGGTIISRLKII